MKTLILFLLFTAFACGQYQQDTLSVDISFPAFPQEVIDNIDHYQWFTETKPQGQNMELYEGMPLAEALALVDVTVGTPMQFPFNIEVLANGDQFNVAVFGLDGNGDELVYELNLSTTYHVGSGVGSVVLPQIYDMQHHYINIQVDVGF